MLRILDCFENPTLYSPSSGNFWDDEHISKGMLEAHLNPKWDAASRNHIFIESSARWIAEIAPPSRYEELLDLGCGPGLYAERFNTLGYAVTGIDFSKRSLEYAKEQSSLNQSNIEYLFQNYLEINYDECFDVITLIYCDYAPFSIDDRKTLLKKVYKALKPEGKFIFDVFTPVKKKEEKRTWKFNEYGGFFNPNRHVHLESIIQYEDNDKTELHHNVIITENDVFIYNIWNHYFTESRLKEELQNENFRCIEIFSDISGKEFSEDSDTICIVATK